MNELECLKVAKLEDVMLDMDQAYCPVTHTFSNGVYVREVFMPKDALVVGHFHSQPHLNIMVSGVLEIIDGIEKIILTAPTMFTGKEGRKVARIIEDTIWLNIYGTDEQDIDKLEKMYMIKSPIFLDRVAETKLLQVREDTGFDEKINIEKENWVNLPYGSYKFKVGDSLIDGKGIITTGNIIKGEFIGICKIGSDSTVLGRFLNNSDKPNCKMVVVGDCIGLIALEDLLGCRGGQDGIELLIDYSLELNNIINCK